MSSSLTVAVAEPRPESVASACAPWVFREGVLVSLRRRHVEQRHGGSCERSVPQTPRHDADGARADGLMNRTAVGQHGKVDLSLKNVEQLVPARMTFPRRLPRIAHQADHALVERRELLLRPAKASSSVVLAVIVSKGSSFSAARIS